MSIGSLPKPPTVSFSTAGANFLDRGSSLVESALPVISATNQLFRMLRHELDPAAFILQQVGNITWDQSQQRMHMSFSSDVGNVAQVGTLLATLNAPRVHLKGDTEIGTALPGAVLSSLTSEPLQSTSHSESESHSERVNMNPFAISFSWAVQNRKSWEDATRYTNSTLVVGDVPLMVLGDVDLYGINVSGQRLVLDIHGNLTLRSAVDTQSSGYEESHHSISISLAPLLIGLPFGLASLPAALASGTAIVGAAPSTLGGGLLTAASVFSGTGVGGSRSHTSSSAVGTRTDIAVGTLGLNVGGRMEQRSADVRGGAGSVVNAAGGRQASEIPATRRTSRSSDWWGSLGRAIMNLAAAYGEVTSLAANFNRLATPPTQAAAPVAASDDDARMRAAEPPTPEEQDAMAAITAEQVEANREMQRVEARARARAQARTRDRSPSPSSRNRAADALNEINMRADALAIDSRRVETAAIAAASTSRVDDHAAAQPESAPVQNTARRARGVLERIADGFSHAANQENGTFLQRETTKAYMAASPEGKKEILAIAAAGVGALAVGGAAVFAPQVVLPLLNAATAPELVVATIDVACGHVEALLPFVRSASQAFKMLNQALNDKFDPLAFVSHYVGNIT